MIRLFEGNRDALDEIEPAQGVPPTLTQALGEELTEQHQTVASYGGVGGGQPSMYHGHGSKESEMDSDARRFFRVVDQAILEHHSRVSALPLILASLQEHHHSFRCRGGGAVREPPLRLAVHSHCFARSLAIRKNVNLF